MGRNENEPKRTIRQNVADVAYLARTAVEIGREVVPKVAKLTIYEAKGRAAGRRIIGPKES